MTLELAVQMPEEYVAEAFRRMQQHLFHNIAAFEQSQAAKFMRGIESEYERVHCVSW